MGKALILAALLLAGCTTTKVPISDPRLIWCANSAPRRDATDETPRWELDEINAHNRRGQLWCGWRKPR